MIKTLVKSIVCCLIIMTSGSYVTADSCVDTAPDLNLSPILATGAMDFSINLYNALKNGTTNMFFSPFSLRVALAMTAVGAEGTTLTQMSQALQLNKFHNQTQINQAFQEYLSSFCPNNNYTLSVANRMYIQDGFSVNPSFTQTLSTFYQSNAETVDFGVDPCGVATTINIWLEELMNYTVQNPFSSHLISDSTVLLLVDAIYFKGMWETPFKADDTRNDTFTLASGKKVEVPIMHLTDSFKYYDSQALQSQVLQLNYAGNRLAMHVILPKEGVILSTVQKKLNSQNINEYVNNLSFKRVVVSLPKFKTNFKLEMKAPLQTLGMLEAFNEKDANLRGIAPPFIDGNLFVDGVFHQVYMAVDEMGTEAAAVTAIKHVMLLSGIVSFSPPVKFNVDRPCIFIIYDLKYNQILFMGNLDDPSII